MDESARGSIQRRQKGPCLTSNPGPIWSKKTHSATHWRITKRRTRIRSSTTTDWWKMETNSMWLQIYFRNGRTLHNGRTWTTRNRMGNQEMQSLPARTRPILHHHWSPTTHPNFKRVHTGLDWKSKTTTLERKTYGLPIQGRMEERQRSPNSRCFITSTCWQPTGWGSRSWTRCQKSQQNRY